MTMTLPLLLLGLALYGSLGWLYAEITKPRPSDTAAAAAALVCCTVVLVVLHAELVREAEERASREDLDERLRRVDATIAESRQVIAEAEAQLRRSGG